LAAGELLPRVLAMVNFIIPLRKRDRIGKSVRRRITVGRAPSNDIVLRHGTVSRDHAWFVCDDNDVFYLGDAGSKNATFVNGIPVSSGGLVALNAGDVLRFGDVSATLCSPEVLWDLLVGEAATTAALPSPALALKPL
jgi:pSer/pThr/pTyr-binding forkhead associated (FHA) protein